LPSVQNSNEADLRLKPGSNAEIYTYLPSRTDSSAFLLRDTAHSQNNLRAVSGNYEVFAVMID